MKDMNSQQLEADKDPNVDVTQPNQETPVLLRSFHSHISELQILRVSYEKIVL